MMNVALIAGAFVAYQAGLFDKIFGSIGGGSGSPGGGSGGGGTVAGSLNFAAVGDIEQTTETATNLASSGAQVILINGDFYYTGSPQTWWDNIMAPVHGMNVHATIGNHDSEGDAALFGQSSFDMSWKDGPVAFISVNTESLDEAFVKAELDRYQADPSVGAIIPFMHKPVVTPQGSHHGAENTGLADLFAQYSKVKLVLSGHNHNYSRSKPQTGGIVCVTVGTGGKDGTTGYPVQLDSNHEVAFAGTPGILSCNYNNGTVGCSFKANSAGSGDSDSFSIQYGAVTTPTPPPIPGNGEEETVPEGEEEPEEEASSYARAMSAAIDMAKYQYTHDKKRYPDLYRPVISVPEYSSYYGSSYVGRQPKVKLRRNSR